MKVEVGSQLVWQGKRVVCTMITTCTEQRLAPWSSEATREDLGRLGNIKILALEIDSFNEGDPVEVSYQRIELTEIGKNLFFLFPYYKFKKRGNDDGSKTAEGSNRTTADAAVENDGSRAQGREGAGEQSAGEDSDASDGAGSGGEGGDAVHPEVSEG